MSTIIDLSVLPRSPAALSAGLSNGVDDTAMLNGLLAAGSLVRGKPGETYLLTGPLTIRSGCTLDMTGCVVRLKDGNATNMLVNAAYKTARTVSDLVTNGTTTVTSATAAFTAADVGRAILIYQGTNANPRHFSTTIASYTNATTVVLTTAVPTTLASTGATIGTRDRDITVRGGYWQRGLCGTPPGTDNTLHSLLFRRCDGLEIVDVTFGSALTGGSGKYGVHIADARGFLVSNYHLINAPSDGLHLGGLCFDFVIDQVRGSTGDDFTAITCTDYSMYNDVQGDVGNGVFQNCVLTGATNGTATPNCVALYGDDAALYSISNVTVRNCEDRYSAAQRTVQATGRLNQITVEHCGGTVAFSKGSGASTAPAMSAIVVRDHRFVYRGSSSSAVLFINVALTDVLIDGLTAANLPSGGVACILVVCQPGTTADIIRVRGVNRTSNRGGVFYAYGANTVINNLVIEDCNSNGVDYSGSTFVVKGDTTAKILNVVLRGVIILKHGFVLSVGQTVACFVSTTACALSDAINTIVCSGTSGVVVNSSSTFWATGGPSLSGGGTLRSTSPDMAVDVSKLAHSTGDAASNTSNANTGTLGVGPCVYTGTAWKSLVSGNTF